MRALLLIFLCGTLLTSLPDTASALMRRSQYPYTQGQIFGVRRTSITSGRMYGTLGRTIRNYAGFGDGSSIWRRMLKQQPPIDRNKGVSVDKHWSASVD